MNTQLTRKFYIPKDAFRSVNLEPQGIEVYIYQAGDKPAALAFHGRAQRPDWHYMFNSEQHRTRKIQEWLDGMTEHARIKREWHQERLQPTELKIGDILSGSWGYDQTNVDYFQVTGRKGERGVYVRPIAAKTVPNSEGFMSSMVIPDPGNFIGAETYHVASKDAIAYDPSERYHPGEHHGKRDQSARLWDGKPDYCSWYA